MKNICKSDPVINSAADYAGVAPEDMHSLNIMVDGTLYEITFHTDYMDYIMYIDGDGSVLGFMSVPLEEHITNTIDYLEEQLCRCR